MADVLLAKHGPTSTSLSSFHFIPQKLIFSIFCLPPELSFKHLAYLGLQQIFSHSLCSYDSNWINSIKCVETLSFQRTVICLLLDLSEILRTEASSSLELNELMICHKHIAVIRNRVFCEARLSAGENTNFNNSSIAHSSASLFSDPHINRLAFTTHRKTSVSELFVRVGT